MYLSVYTSIILQNFVLGSSGKVNISMSSVCCAPHCNEHWGLTKALAKLVEVLRRMRACGRQTFELLQNPSQKSLQSKHEA